MVYPPGAINTVPRPGLMADKEEVLRAIDNPGTCTINALRKVQHAGLELRDGIPHHVFRGADSDDPRVSHCTID